MSLDCHPGAPRPLMVGHRNRWPRPPAVARSKSKAASRAPRWPKRRPLPSIRLGGKLQRPVAPWPCGALLARPLPLLRARSPGWGPSGRRFKSCLPDQRRALHSAAFEWDSRREKRGFGEQLGNNFFPNSQFEPSRRGALASNSGWPGQPIADRIGPTSPQCPTPPPTHR
jgi:hypothetical protein